MSDNVVIALVLIVPIMCFTAYMITVAIIGYKRNKNSNQEVVDHMAEHITEAIDQSVGNLGEAARHHVQINAILALTESFTDNPELLENLAGYSRQNVAAALLFRVNSLGDSIENVQRGLAESERCLAATNGGSRYIDEVEQAKSQLDRLLAEQVAANQAVQQFTGVPA